MNVNAYVTGTANIKLVCVKEHSKCSGHIAATGVYKVASVLITETPIVQLLAHMCSECEDRMVKLFNISYMYNIAKQELPVVLFPVWAKTDKHHRVLIGETYLSDKQRKNFVNELALDLEHNLKNTI